MTEVSEYEQLVKDINDVNSRILKLKWKDLSDDVCQSLCTLARSLGNLIKTQLYEDSLDANKKCKTIEILYEQTLQSNNVKQWIKEQNKILTNFICSSTGIYLEKASEKKINAVAHVLEQFLYAKNQQIVTPFSAQRSIVSYSMTRSKTVAELYGSWESSGSYATIERLLKSPSAKPICPSGDVHITIDNNQKVSSFF